MQEGTKSLEALLRFRVALERMQWLRVQTAFTQVQKAERELEQLEQSRVEAKLEILRAMRTSVESRILELYSTAGIERQMAEQRERKQQQVKEFEKERQDYFERRRERETVESALARMKVQIEKDLQRKEQMKIDDDTLQRMSRQARKSPLLM